MRTKLSWNLNVSLKNSLHSMYYKRKKKKKKEQWNKSFKKKVLVPNAGAF